LTAGGGVAGGAGGGTVWQAATSSVAAAASGTASAAFFLESGDRNEGSLPVWLIIAEALLALGLLVFIVWWTMFHGRKKPPK
jgi:hypothetical protein